MKSMTNDDICKELELLNKEIDSIRNRKKSLIQDLCENTKLPEDTLFFVLKTSDTVEAARRIRNAFSFLTSHEPDYGFCLDVVRRIRKA